MTVLRNNFDTGPDGTTITTANSGTLPGNNAFDGVTGTGTGVIRQYSAAQARPTAEFTARLATGATAGAPSVNWSTSMGSQNEIWHREYILLDSYPLADATFFVADNGVVYGILVGIQASTGRLFVFNSPQSVFVTFTTSLPLDEWFRIESRFQFSSTVGNWEMRLFTDADSETPVETLTRSNWNMGASTVNAFTFGYTVTAGANYPNMYMSGLELNNTGWPGPAPFRPGKGVPGILTNAVAPFTDAS